MAAVRRKHGLILTVPEDLKAANDSSDSESSMDDRKASSAKGDVVRSSKSTKFNNLYLNLRCLGGLGAHWGSRESHGPREISTRICPPFIFSLTPAHFSLFTSLKSRF